MLGRTYRFVYNNATGQTIAAGAIVTRGRRYNFNSSNVQTWEGSEASIDSSAGTLGTGAYLAGTTQDNSTSAHVGGTFTFSVTAPPGASGPVSIFLQRSTDGGTTWPDNGFGMLVKTFNFTTNETKIDVVEL